MLIPVWRRGRIVAHAVVDDIDGGLATQKWYLHSDGYAYRAGRQIDGLREPAVYLHREVLSRPAGIVDHWNHDPLDCRRENLRLTDKRGNGLNRKGAAKHSKTGIRGVYQTRAGTFQARYDKRSLGTYATATEAAAMAARARCSI